MLLQKLWNHRGKHLHNANQGDANQYTWTQMFDLFQMCFEIVMDANVFKGWFNFQWFVGCLLEGLSPLWLEWPIPHHITIQNRRYKAKTILWWTMVLFWLVCRLPMKGSTWRILRQAVMRMTMATYLHMWATTYFNIFAHILACESQHIWSCST